MEESFSSNSKTFFLFQIGKSVSCILLSFRVITPSTKDKNEKTFHLLRSYVNVYISVIFMLNTLFVIDPRHPVLVRGRGEVANPGLGEVRRRFNID